MTEKNCVSWPVNRSRPVAITEKICVSWPVSRVLYGRHPFGMPTWRPFLLDVCCQTPPATNPGDRPKKPYEVAFTRRPYLVLLPVGFTLPLLLPVARCAFTAPFHPYLNVAFAPSSGLFSVALSLRSPPPAINRHRFSVEPGLSSKAFAPAAARPTDTGWH